MRNSGEQFQLRHKEVITEDGSFEALWLDKKQNERRYVEKDTYVYKNSHYKIQKLYISVMSYKTNMSEKRKT